MDDLDLTAEQHAQIAEARQRLAALLPAGVMPPATTMPTEPEQIDRTATVIGDDIASYDPTADELSPTERFLVRLGDGGAGSLDVLPPPPTAPLGVFHPQIQRTIKDLAHVIDAPESLAVAAILGLAAAGCGGKRVAKIFKRHLQPGNLNITILGDSDIGKTAMMNIVFESYYKDDLERIRNYNRLFDEYEEKIKEWEKAGKKGIKPKEPVQNTFILNDFTREILIKRAEVNPSQAVIVDEISTFHESIDAYSQKGRQPTKELLLSAYNGGSVKFDRIEKSRCSIAQHIYLTLIGGLQPDRIFQYFSKDDIISGGFGRTTFIRCVRNHPHEYIDDEIKTETENTLHVLSSFFLNMKPDENNEPISIEISEDARDIWRKWFKRKYSFVHQFLPKLEPIAGKQIEQAARFSLLLHLMNNAMVSENERENIISKQTIISGIKIAEWTGIEQYLIWFLLKSNNKKMPKSIQSDDIIIAKILIKNKDKLMEIMKKNKLVPNHDIYKLLKENNYKIVSEESVGSICTRLSIPNKRTSIARGRTFDENVFASLNKFIMKV